MDKAYIETVRLLLESVPIIFEAPHFAMKGGTAINLFIEDMPRLSVDIDVVYTNHEPARDEALKAISTSLGTVQKRLATARLESEISSTKDGDEFKLFPRLYEVRAADAENRHTSLCGIAARIFHPKLSASGPRSLGRTIIIAVNCVRVTPAQSRRVVGCRSQEVKYECDSNS